MKTVLAFDIGGTNTRLAKIDENFNIVQCEIIPTKVGTVRDFMENVDEIISRFDLSDVVAIGAGVPGVVDKKTAYIYDLPNVHIKDIPFGEYLKKKYGKEVFLRNDAEIACLAEAVLGAGKDYDRVFFITISTGLGGALVVDKINQDYVTEIGHTAYKYKDQMLEYEYLASGTGIKNLCHLNGLEVKNSKEFFELYISGDNKAKAIFNDWLKILNDFIKMIDDSYMPEIITVTGGVMKEKELFFDKIKDANPDLNIVETYFSEQSGLMGAAVYAFKMMKII